jgi:methionyl-tRNA formyltransferase
LDTLSLHDALPNSDTAIDWRASAATIDRQVRACDPVPGACTARNGELVKVWTAEPATAPLRRGEPGEVLRADGDGLIVACGQGALRVTELQPAGGRRMAAAAFAAGRRIAAGQRFDMAQG